MTSLPVERPGPTLEQAQGLGLDTGDDDDEVRELRALCGCTAHSRARGEAVQTLTREAGDKARRGVVERTQSGMHGVRRLLVRWGQKVRHDLALLHVACASITYRYSGLVA